MIVIIFFDCINNLKNQRSLFNRNLTNTNKYIKKNYEIYFDYIIKYSYILSNKLNEYIKFNDAAFLIQSKELIINEMQKNEKELSQLFDSFSKRLLINETEVIYSYNITSSDLDYFNEYLTDDIKAEIVFDNERTYAKIINNIYSKTNYTIKDIYFFDLSNLLNRLEDEKIKITLLFKENGFFSSNKSEFYSQQSINKINEDNDYFYYLSEFDNIEGAVKTYESSNFLYNDINSTILNSIISCLILISLIIFSFLMIGYKNSSLLKEIETQKEAYKKLSNKDGLTDVYNRRYFNQWLDIIENGPFYRKIISSIIMIDINSFKKINDSYGHLVGDEVLKEVSSIIKSQIRTTDYMMRDLNGLSHENMVVRYGGDEFVIFLKRCSEKNALRITEKIAFKIRENERFPFKIKISYGISEINENTTIQEALDIADKRMYEMKKNIKKSE